MTPNKLNKMWKSIKEEHKVIGFYSHVGEYAGFSNFYNNNPFYYKIPENCGIHSGKICHIQFSEKAIMLCKASLMGDTKTFNLILKAKTPFIAKKLGRQVHPFNEELWQKNVCYIAKDIIICKFNSSETLKKLLLDTDDDLLAEASPRDKIWGIGMSNNLDISYPYKWKGCNILGWALMEARDALKNNILSN
jgi:ribA/ribD-fused uncharacterized protein